MKLFVKTLRPLYLCVENSAQRHKEHHVSQEKVSVFVHLLSETEHFRKNRKL